MLFHTYKNFLNYDLEFCKQHTNYDNFFFDSQIKLITYIKRFISAFLITALTYSSYVQFFMFAIESISVQIKFWPFSYENFENTHILKYFNLF